jgi:hypothetical protein
MIIVNVVVGTAHFRVFFGRILFLLLLLLLLLFASGCVSPVGLRLQH